MIKRVSFPILLLCLAACQATVAQVQKIDDYTWEGVERIVAIGDLHGDYENYIETLRAAGLVNRRGRWTGDETHLVQTGDIPDRGPETRKIMEHIDKLAGQAEKDGGRVHRLIGNHEAMNVYGDLRYVTVEEFEDFAGRNSRALLDRYYELVLQDMQQNNPEAYAALPENHREQWEAEHPPGFVEHRQAWDPAWNPEGEYALRAQGLKTAVKINGNLFVHGGISDLYADQSLAKLTEDARSALANFNYENPGMVADECGPFWYRGLSGETPEASSELLTSILDRLSAERIVVGHTPTPGIVWPRYDGRVVQIDTGISSHYGGRPAFLEITSEGLFAGYPSGRLALPTTDEERLQYLDEVIAMHPENSSLKRFREMLTAPPKDEGQDAGDPADESEEAATDDGQAGEELPDQPQPNLCLREEAAGSAPAF